MQIATKIDEFIGYFSAAAERIFGPNRDGYPATGVQPFEGKVNKSKRRN